MGSPFSQGMFGFWNSQRIDAVALLHRSWDLVVPRNTRDRPISFHMVPIWVMSWLYRQLFLRLNKAFSEVIICFYFEPFLNVILGFMVNSCTFVRLHLVILLNRDFDKKSDCQDCGMEIFIWKKGLILQYLIDCVLHVVILCLKTNMYSSQSTNNYRDMLI